MLLSVIHTNNFHELNGLSMTSTEEDLSGGMVCPFTGTISTASEVRALDAKRELVRQQCVEQYLSSPLYLLKPCGDLGVRMGFVWVKGLVGLPR